MNTRASNKPSASASRTKAHKYIDSAQPVMHNISMKAEPLWKEAEVASYLQISKRHVVNLRKRGLLSWVRLGRSVRYIPKDVEAALSKLTIRQSK